MPEEELALVEELRAVWAGVPIPTGWHPGAAAIARLDEDVRAAFAVLAEDAAARAALARILEGEPGRSVEPRGALARLRELPRPDGKHPYLAEIMPGLEVAEAVLAAVAQRAPASTPAGS
jgi:hypothetical protein